MSEFSEKVYNCIFQIPTGRITTYKEIAKALNKSTNYSRAIARTVCKNPYSFIPSHRVISNNGDINGIDKYQKLESEGIIFTYKYENCPEGIIIKPKLNKKEIEKYLFTNFK